MTTELRCWRVAIAWLLALPAAAAEAPPEPPDDAQAAHQVVPGGGLRARLLGADGLPIRDLDTAIFLDVAPVTAAEPAVRLPDDQRDDD